MAHYPIASSILTAGLRLADGETPAHGSALLRAPAQLALQLCLVADRLDYRRRCGWQQPDGTHARIADITIHSLTANGLMTIVSHGRFRKHARLTARGVWYARTLFSAAPSTTPANEANHVPPQID